MQLVIWHALLGFSRSQIPVQGLAEAQSTTHTPGAFVRQIHLSLHFRSRPPPQMSAGVFTVSLLGKQGRSTLGDSSRSEQIITHRLFVFLIQMHQIMLSMHGPLPKRELLRTYTVLNMIYSPAVINHKYIYISS